MNKRRLVGEKEAGRQAAGAPKRCNCKAFQFFGLTTSISLRQVKYFNNIAEQDHRRVKRITRPMLGFKAFDAAQSTLVGIALMPMIKKRQLVVEERDEGRTAAELFDSLAA
jgi:transposase-like protein